MKSQTFFNSLIGINYEKNEYFLEIYDMNDNKVKKKSMNEILFEKFDKNLKYDNDIKIDTFCFDCKKNINLEKSLDCKNHNIKILNDLKKDINIESIEKNLNIIVKDYENILKYLEEKIINFRRRNDNQIVLAKKIIEAYKANIDNYQIISNTKNLLNFNDINYKLITQKDLPINLEYNILKDYPVSNYLKETISIEKIQKNLKIELDTNNSIDCVILFPKDKRLIFNINEKIFLFNTKINVIDDKIESDTEIIFMNLMDDKKTILISHKNFIEKLIIENGKLKLENFLTEHIIIHKPGVIINYKDEFAWTNGTNIGFINDNYYNIMDTSSDIFTGGYSGGYKVNIVNLFQYKDDILFIFFSVAYDHHFDSYESIQMGSYFRKSNTKNFIRLDEFGPKVNPHTDYKIHCFKNDELIIFALKNIYIIDFINWTKKVKIPISNRIIKNSYYLNDSCFLLFFGDLDDSDYEDYSYEDYDYIKLDITKKKKKYNIAIMKIVGNNAKFIYDNLVNFGNKRLYYNFNGSIDQYGLSQNIIALSGNYMEFYRFVNIKKSFEIENNKI